MKIKTICLEGEMAAENLMKYYEEDGQEILKEIIQMFQDLSEQSETWDEADADT